MSAADPVPPADPVLLVDIGSTVVKVCAHDGTRPGPVRLVPRDPAVAPGEQVLALAGGAPRLRVCSSANGGLRVGVLGLTRGHSTAAAVRAAVAAGGNVVYADLLGLPRDTPAPPVDVLVLVGGVDGADPVHLRDRLGRAPQAGRPHEVLVWAGADEPGVVAGLPVDHVVPNVLDHRLRPATGALADLVSGLYVEDLVDSKGLRALAGRTEVAVWPTPAVVSLAAGTLAAGGAPFPDVTTPFIVVDVGGATTDAYYCAELRAGTARPAPGESVVRRVFTDLGVVASLPALRQAVTTHPGLLDLAAALDPDDHRERYHQLCAGDWPPGPTAFLACLYLALHRLVDPARGPEVDPSGVVGLLVTGGAKGGADTDAVRRVAAAALGVPEARWHLRLDTGYELWAHGLAAVPGATGQPSTRKTSADSCAASSD
ncbi:glutamate mutase L [Actinokineospora bangkokensis]|uniref:Glutamate mutase n=1 Tax=Actinokineospora bangkokensis TaxID=1193682 RepID=A0A1Q9LRI2_9PSEU|nr:glutamate mutase L [Actinokineospora bangkokensis]OLR94646.1 hypothetical protein BJP25_13050 [Actinokineospora bangkokensis]